MQAPPQHLYTSHPHYSNSLGSSYGPATRSFPPQSIKIMSPLYSSQEVHSLFGQRKAWDHTTPEPSQNSGTPKEHLAFRTKLRLLLVQFTLASQEQFLLE